MALLQIPKLNLIALWPYLSQIFDDDWLKIGKHTTQQLWKMVLMNSSMYLLFNSISLRHTQFIIITLISAVAII